MAPRRYARSVRVRVRFRVRFRVRVRVRVRVVRDGAKAIRSVRGEP